MITIFNSEQDALSFSNKIHQYLLDVRPGYSAEKWSDPEISSDGLTWMVKVPVEYDDNRWGVPLDISEELNISVGSTESLPDVGGLCTIDNYYLYKGDVIKCRQTHNRTIYEPKDTPALFSFYRDNSGQLEWIVGEQVEIGWVRIYDDIKYEVIQSHMTQSDWFPTATLGVLWKAYHDLVGIPIWVQPVGSSDSYMIGDQVIFSNAVWESLINYNVWSPTVYPLGWNKLYDI